MERSILTLEGAENVRDLGGYLTKDGKQVKRKKMIRSAGLSTLTSVDQQFLSTYGVRTVVDFRSPEEQEEAPDKPIQKAIEKKLPVFSTDETKAAPRKLMRSILDGQSATAELIAVYREFVEEAHARTIYRKFLDLALESERPEESILFHCTAGKDRTGFAAAILYLLLGVDRETILADYLRTNQLLEQRRSRMLSMAKEKGASEKMLAELSVLLSAKADFLEASFSAMDEKYDGVEGFLRDGLKVTSNERRQLAKIYLT